MNTVPSNVSSPNTGSESHSANPMWGGHYSQAPAAIMAQINASIDVDKRMFAQDIAGSRAHAAMLVKAGILTADEEQRIQTGLNQIEGEIREGRLPFSIALEDIHMHVESRLAELIGDTAGKLHTARSRNDQVATDFKLWVRDAIDHVQNELAALKTALLKQAEAHAATIMPGFTHLQTAQPITFGHHLLAYVEMLSRDAGRLKDCRARLNECPLGSAALAGTSYPVDRHMTAQALGFSGPTRNSLDSVSDRDFAIEYLSALALLGTHLSRFAEEIVLWMSAGFKFITLSEAFTTGSSIMPQKRNPDAAELVRAKTGTLNGALINLLTMMKGLPLAYSKDMQEDKKPVFEATDAILLSVRAMTGMVQDMQPNKANMRAAAQAGYSTATDLADWLVQNLGIPFRQCHHIVGRIVQLAEGKGVRLDELSLVELQSIEPRITAAAQKVLSVDFSVQSRTSFGGTAPENVVEMVKKTSD